MFLKSIGSASGNRRVIISDSQIMIMNSEQNIKKLFDSDHKQTTEGGWSLKEGSALPEICDYVCVCVFVWRYFQVHQWRAARTQAESCSEIGLRIGQSSGLLEELEHEEEHHKRSEPQEGEPQNLHINSDKSLADPILWIYRDS